MVPARRIHCRRNGNFMGELRSHLHCRPPGGTSFAA
jgi:hypothetical protein